MLYYLYDGGMIMHKKIISLLFLLLLCTGCASNNQPPHQPTAIVLGFSQLGSESGWRLGNTRSITDAAKKAGIELMFENAEQKQENQIKAIRSFIAYQVDVIAFAPIVMDGWDTVLQEAKEAGIPVLITDRLIHTVDDSLFAGYIGSDFKAEGRSAGEFLLKRTESMEQVRIVEIKGTDDSAPALQRSEGFYETIQNDPRYVIVKSITGDFMRTKGKECMEHILSENKSIDVLYSHNDAMTYGAIEAIEEAGLLPGKDIIIITVDGEQAAIDLLRKGKINCVVECTPMIGETIMTLAKELVSRQSIDKYIFSKESVFTEYDDLSLLGERGY